ncbi:dolichol kinase, putative [Trypanosoma cruzi]|nr:dolichol kinase, putative [Trypanosoma cruzi]KAF8283874.1 putative dolichol kinase [Trypanosoma cruzi]RNF24744.1 putative dolichol kinase [Trypanosoma cruzi]
MIYPRLRVEVSYSSTVIMMWVVLLAVMSWNANHSMQSLTILFLSTVALTSPHGESRMLLPMLFLSEHLLDNLFSSGRSPLEFYASTLLSYLTLVVCRAARKRKCNENIFIGSVICAAEVIVVLYFISEDCVMSFGAAAFVLLGLAFFLALLPVIGENEAVLISSLVGFYICDMVTNNSLTEGESSPHAPGLFTKKTHIAARGAVICAISMNAVLFLGSKCCMVPRVNISKSSERVISVERITILFWSSLVCVVAVIYYLVGFHLREDALMWMINYFTSARHRPWILLLWGGAVPLSVICVERFTGGLRKTARRKLFHFIAVVLFTPVALVDPSFLSLSLSIASSIAILVELSRFYGVYGSSTLNAFMLEHIDGRDSIRGAVRTHIYLIYGLGLSMMLRFRYERPEPVLEFSSWMELAIHIIPGLVSLGIVDACAGIVGSTFLLSHRRALGRYLNNSFFTERANSSITHKTTTGTFGGLLCGVLFWLFILLVAGNIREADAGHSFILILVCSLTECFMDGIDNLQLPLVVDGAVHTLLAFLVHKKKAK